MTTLEKSLKDECENKRNRYADLYYFNYVDNKTFDGELMIKLNQKWESETIYNYKNIMLMAMCFDRWRDSSVDHNDAISLSK